MNPSELKAALVAMRYDVNALARGPDATTMPCSYLLGFRWEWNRFLKSKAWKGMERTARSKAEALHMAVIAFDSFVCDYAAKDGTPTAPTDLYIGVRRLLQRLFSNTFLVFQEVRGSLIYVSDDSSFGTEHSLVLEPKQGTVAEGLQAAGISTGMWIDFPNVKIEVTPSDSEELVEIRIHTRIGLPLPVTTRVSFLCSQVRGFSKIPHYSGNYL